MQAEPSAERQYQSEEKLSYSVFKASSLTTLIVLIKQQIECVGEEVWELESVLKSSKNRSLCVFFIIVSQKVKANDKITG